MTRYLDFIKFVAILIVLFLSFKIGTNIWFKRRFKKLIGSKRLIHEIDSEGFSIFTTDNKSEKILWNDIDFVNLIPDDRILIFSLNNNKKEFISDKQYYDWLILVKAIPSSIAQNPQLIIFRRDYFNDLICCKICGKISVKSNNCLRCNSQTYSCYKESLKNDWPTSIDEIQSELEYTKENQLEWFSESLSHENFSFYSKDFAFSNCPEWEPIVTTDEIKTYIKSNNT